MNQSSEQPSNKDAILGGNAPPPAQAAVLGGLPNAELRLKSPSLATKLSALKDCTNYGQRGLNYVIEALNDPLPRTQYEAYLLLRNRTEPEVKEALRRYKFWQHFERLNGLPNSHVSTFANRRVEDFSPEVGIQDSISTAYAVRLDISNYPIADTFKDKFSQVLLNPQSNVVEALVFGCWGDWDTSGSGDIVSCLVEGSQKLTNLTALFIGDIEDEEMMISDITHGNLSQALLGFPQLEILKIRGSGRNWSREHRRHLTDFRFDRLRHEKLIALTIESGGLNRDTVRDVCALELPELEYLEIWPGRDEYGGNSSIEDVMPIISGEAFPKLKYLGLRNCEYADDIASALVKSPLLERLIELDFSLGTLSDEGVAKLLKCPALENLATLNVSENYLSDTAVDTLRSVGIEVLADEQRGEDEDNRYCVVGE
jgi:hypothetical protein